MNRHTDGEHLCWCLPNTLWQTQDLPMCTHTSRAWKPHALSKVSLLKRDHKATILGQSTHTQWPDHPLKLVHEYQEQQNKDHLNLECTELLAFFPILLSRRLESLLISLLVKHSWAEAAVAKAPDVENVHTANPGWDKTTGNKRAQSRPLTAHSKGGAWVRTPMLHGCGSSKARTSKMPVWESDQQGAFSQHCPQQWQFLEPYK